MALTAGVRLAAAGLQQVYLTRLELRLMLGESVQFLWHVLRLPVAFFQHRFTGDLVSRAMNTARVAVLISGELATTAISLLTLVVYVAVMILYDPLLAVVGVGISSLNLLALKWFSRWRLDRMRAIEQLRGRLMAGVMWAIQIIESVKATGSESDLLVRWTGDQARMINAEQALGVGDALLLVLPSFLAGLTAIVVLGLGGYQVTMGSMTHRSPGRLPVAPGRFQPAVPRSGPSGGRHPGAPRRPRADRRRAQSADRPGVRQIAASGTGRPRRRSRSRDRSG